MPHGLVIREIGVQAHDAGGVMLDGSIDRVLVYMFAVAFVRLDEKQVIPVAAECFARIWNSYVKSDVELLNRTPHAQTTDQPVLSISADRVYLAYKSPRLINMIDYDRACLAFQVDEMLVGM